MDSEVVGMPLGLEVLGRAVMNRARRGLYAGRHIGFGNKVSEDGGNKSRRTWKPNVHYKRLFSHILDGLIRVRVSTHALKCIDKAGGIDEYLLQTPDQKLNSDVGVKWKRLMEDVMEEHKKRLSNARSIGAVDSKVEAS